MRVPQNRSGLFGHDSTSGSFTALEKLEENRTHSPDGLETSLRREMKTRTPAPSRVEAPHRNSEPHSLTAAAAAAGIDQTAQSPFIRVDCLGQGSGRLI